jgi:hypothetical protein
MFVLGKMDMLHFWKKNYSYYKKVKGKGKVVPVL